jgi:peptidoglycan L-alanyl-D-glutamate endopeptidase CwlK
MQLLPELWKLYDEFRMAMYEAKIDFILTCTYRSQEEQVNLYEQGRSKPGHIVTWTKRSKHTERKAFDIAIIKDGKITWDSRDYQKAGEIGMKIGLQWGGFFHPPDSPHFEVKK